jgi:AraC-like DNA-binding protein
VGANPTHHPSSACISLHGARAAYVGPGLELAPHRNAVAVVALALAEPFALALLDAKPATPTFVVRGSALIPPGALHQLEARGPMAFVYLDALSDEHTAVRQADLDAAHDTLRRVDGHADWTVDRLCELLHLPPRPRPDPRIAAALRAIDARPEAFTSLADVARLTGLSTSRCRELIRETAGVPFRRYRLWRRMARVAEELARSRSLTEAAHAAGFASSAHLSAAFKAMFGLPPSKLLELGVRFEL